MLLYLVLLDPEGGVATLTLNRPLLFNVLSSGMLEAVHSALEEIAASLQQAARDWARAIAGKSGAALSSGKALLRAQRNLSVADAYALADDTMARDMLSNDARLGNPAFIQKQPSPEWTHQ